MPRLSWPVYALLLCALAALLYAPVGAHLLDTHDADYFADSEETLRNPSYFFSADKRMPGRPLFELLILLEYAVWGANPRLFHWAGVVLHAIAAWVLALICFRACRGWDGAQLAGALFICICAPFQAVQWISAHCYSLALICSCLSLALFVQYVDKGGAAAAAGTVLLQVLGIASHISAAAIVPFAFYIAYKKRALRREVMSLLGVMAVFGLLSVLAIKMLYVVAPQNMIAARGFDLWMAAENYLFLWGRLLSSSYWIPARPDLIGGGEIALGAGALCVGLWAGFRSEWKGGAAVVWIGLSLLPPLLLQPEYVRTLSSGPSRYLYLSSAGTACVTALFILAGHNYARRWVGVKWSVFGTIAILCMLLTSSWYNIRRADALAYYTEARHALAVGDIDLGIEQMLKALAVKRGVLNREDLYVRLCPMLLNRGREVKPHLDTARTLFPENPTLHMYEQVIRSMDGDTSSLRYLSRFRSNESVRKAIAEAYHHAGRGAYRQADYGRSVAALSRALSFDPNRPRTRASLKAAQGALQTAQ